MRFSGVLAESETIERDHDTISTWIVLFVLVVAAWVGLGRDLRGIDETSLCSFLYSSLHQPSSVFCAFICLLLCLSFFQHYSFLLFFSNFSLSLAPLVPSPIQSMPSQSTLYAFLFIDPDSDSGFCS